MKRVCSWCGRDLGETPSDRHHEELVTHTICDDCAYHVLARIGMPLEKFLEGLKAPVLVVDAAGIVKTANSRARALTGKDLREIQGKPGGDVFECEYAALPEGCGNTIHCSGCAIRRSVEETHATGRSLDRVPATLHQRTSGKRQKIRFLISTEKVGELVLLRIDQIKPEKVDEQAATATS